MYDWPACDSAAPRARRSGQSVAFDCSSVIDARNNLPTFPACCLTSSVNGPPLLDLTDLGYDATGPCDDYYEDTETSGQSTW